MTKEKLQSLVDKEISQTDPKLWDQVANDKIHVVLIPQVKVKELEEFVVEEVNRYLDILDTLYPTKKTRRKIGPELKHVYIKTTRTERDSFGLAHPPVNIDDGLMIIDYLNCGGHVSFTISDLLKTDEFIQKEIQEFKEKHEDTVEELIMKIGKSQEEYEQVVEEMKKRGYEM